MKLPIKLKGLKLPGLRRRGAADDEDADEDEDDFGEDEPDEDEESLSDDLDENEDGGKRRFRLPALPPALSHAVADKRQLIIIAGGGAVVLLVVVGSAWWFFMGDDEPAAVAARDPNIPRVVIDVAPQGPGRGGALTPPGADDGTGEPSTLNTIGADPVGPGAGLVVASVADDAFSGIPRAGAESPLPEVPDPALVEQGSHGPLPRVADDGRAPWQVYMRPFDPRDDRPRIAVVVDGLGLNRTTTEAAIRRLPGSVTLAFSPYGQGLDEWVPLARQTGHEILLSLPMESAAFPAQDAGPYALKGQLDAETNLDRLEFVLSRLHGYVGVITVMGSGFATSEADVRPVLAALKSRGLMMVDGGGAPESLAPALATEIGLPRAVTDLVIGADASRGSIDMRLAEVEDLVRRHAAAVVVIAPSPAAVERVAAWAGTLESKNLVLAPVSAIADRQLLP